MAPEQSENKQRSLLPDDRELEEVRAESVAAKEELNSCREKVEKLKEVLMVRTKYCHCYLKIAWAP